VLSQLHVVEQPAGPDATDPHPVPGWHFAPWEHEGVVGQGNSRTHWWLDSTYWPPTLLPSGQTRAMSGTASSEQFGSKPPPLLELPPFELLLKPPPLLETPPPELVEPLLDPPPPPDPLPELVPLLLEPPDEPGAGLPSPRSARPIQPTASTPMTTDGTKRARRVKAMVLISAACVPQRYFPRMAGNKGFRHFNGVP
jgi:hypothetical protein